MPTDASPWPMHQRRKGPEISNEKMYSHKSSSGSSSNHRGAGGYDIEGGRHRGGGSSNQLSASDANTSILEQQNNERINLLSDQVARLKGLTIDIGNEVREQNTFLDSMGDGFVSTRDMLQGSLRRIGTMLESGGAKHMCYMVGFAVFVMIFLWWLMNHKGTSGA